MPAWLFDLVFTLNRWIHVVGTTVLVGGVLFFKFVVPLATEHLQDEQQLAVFGQARWIFRRVVWWSVIALVLSGVVSVWRVWPIYLQQRTETQNLWLTSLPWALGHVTLGSVGFLTVFRVTATARLRERPVFWLGVALIVMLVAIFLASASRHVELRPGYGMAHK